jgi:D-alanyl-D-alanine carboxypeptidase/D-alanyl-D-alanine-endopeptidase (penicillin-binding protein 4)
VLGDVVREPRPPAAYTVASHEGSTLSTTVTRTLKASDNFAAEMLLKELGRGVRADGSSAGGLAAVRSVLGGQGVPVGAGSDGSGLSANDRQTAAGQVKLLQLAERSNVAVAFRGAMPLGCRDGTLRRRFCRTSAEGRVWAKTGTISGVRALSGVTRTASGRQVQFTFQLSGVSNGAKALAAIDRAVVVLAGSRDRRRAPGRPPPSVLRWRTPARRQAAATSALTTGSPTRRSLRARGVGRGPTPRRGRRCRRWPPAGVRGGHGAQHR